MEDCVTLAHQAGERIARELSIPVFFYERAALKPERVNLEDVQTWRARVVARTDCGTNRPALRMSVR